MPRKRRRQKFNAAEREGIAMSKMDEYRLKCRPKFRAKNPPIRLELFAEREQSVIMAEIRSHYREMGE